MWILLRDTQKMHIHLYYKNVYIPPLPLPLPDPCPPCLSNSLVNTSNSPPHSRATRRHSLTRYSCTGPGGDCLARSIRWNRSAMTEGGGRGREGEEVGSVLTGLVFEHDMLEHVKHLPLPLGLTQHGRLSFRQRSHACSAPTAKGWCCWNDFQRGYTVSSDRYH